MKVRDVVEISLLYIGVPAITLYPLGFVALGVQLWKDPFFPYYDYNIIWNAVALIPSTVVVGTGVELLYLSAISTILGTGIAFLTFSLLQKRYPDNDEEDPERRRRNLWSFYFIVLLPVAAFLAWNSIVIDRWQEDILFVVGFFVFSIGRGVLIGYVRVRGLGNLFLPGLGVAYVGAILATLCIATLDKPNLPVVEIDTHVGSAANDCSSHPDKTFVKLSETEHYWHVYNQKGLFALPVEEVKGVRYQDCPR